MHTQEHTMKSMSVGCYDFKRCFVLDMTLNIFLQSSSQAFDMVLCIRFKHAGMHDASRYSLCSSPVFFCLQIEVYYYPVATDTKHTHT